MHAPFLNCHGDVSLCEASQSSLGALGVRALLSGCRMTVLGCQPVMRPIEQLALLAALLCYTAPSSWSFSAARSDVQGASKEPLSRWPRHVGGWSAPQLRPGAWGDVRRARGFRFGRHIGGERGRLSEKRSCCAVAWPSRGTSSGCPTGCPLERDCFGSLLRPLRCSPARAGLSRTAPAVCGAATRRCCRSD